MTPTSQKPAGPTLPDVGQPAPLIRATTSTGEAFDLSDMAGRYVVVWFFPRANTPG